MKKVPCNDVLHVVTTYLSVTGYENAKKTQCTHIAVFTAASETFANKNINSTISDSLNRYRELCKKASEDGLQVRGYGNASPFSHYRYRG